MRHELRRPGLIAAMIFTAVSLTAGDATAGAPGVDQVPVDVVEVATAGYWRIEDASGRYRLVVTSHGQEHLATRVRVERLGSDTIVSSVLIEELSDSPMFIVTQVVGSSMGEQGAAFELTLDHRYEGSTRKVRAEFSDDDRYRLVGWPPE